MKGQASIVSCRKWPDATVYYKEASPFTRMHYVYLAD